MLLDRADRDIYNAKLLISPSGNPSGDELLDDMAAYHVQQGIEKALKYTLNTICGLDEDKYSQEYYFMKNDNSAVDVFDYAVLNLDNIYAEDSSAEIDSRNNSYSVDASNYYVTVTRKDNTVLYVTAYPDYADEAQELMKSIGF